MTSLSNSFINLVHMLLYRIGLRYDLTIIGDALTADKLSSLQDLIGFGGRLFLSLLIF